MVDPIVAADLVENLSYDFSAITDAGSDFYDGAIMALAQVGLFDMAIAVNTVCAIRGFHSPEHEAFLEDAINLIREAVSSAS